MPAAYTLKGKVKDAALGTPIPNVLVKIVSAAGPNFGKSDVTGAAVKEILGMPPSTEEEGSTNALWKAPGVVRRSDGVPSPVPDRAACPVTKALPAASRATLLPNPVVRHMEYTKSEPVGSILVRKAEPKREQPGPKAGAVTGNRTLEAAPVT